MENRAIKTLQGEIAEILMSATVISLQKFSETNRFDYKNTQSNTKEFGYLYALWLPLQLWNVTPK